MMMVKGKVKGGLWWLDREVTLVLGVTATPAVCVVARET